MYTEVLPAQVLPGEWVRLSVRDLPSDVEAVWCRGGKLTGGFDTPYPLCDDRPGTWSTQLPVSRYASAGAIRLFLYLVRHDGVDERHDIQAGGIAVAPQPLGGPVTHTTVSHTA